MNNSVTLRSVATAKPLRHLDRGPVRFVKLPKRFRTREVFLLLPSPEVLSAGGRFKRQLALL